MSFLLAFKAEPISTLTLDVRGDNRRKVNNELTARSGAVF